MNEVCIYDKNIHGILTLYVQVPYSLNTHVGFFSLAGSYAETENNQGVAHYLEHLFFKGTEKRDLFKISDDAALLGAEQNAYTSEYNTQYYLNVPKVNTEGAIELLCDMMFHPTFPKEEIEKERTVIQEERKMYEDDPQSFFFNKTQSKFFRFDSGHNIIGTKETINALKRDDFVDYRNRMYGLNTTILVIVSDMDQRIVFDLCAKYLEGNPFVPNQAVPIQSAILLGEDKTYAFDRKNIQQSYLAGVFNGKGLASTDNEAKQCMFNAIGGGMFSLFFKEIREKLGLCYSVGAYKFLSNHDNGIVVYYSQMDPKNALLTQRKMIEITSDVKKNGLSREIFECAKAEQLGSFCRVNSNISGIANMVGVARLHGIELDFNKKYQNFVALSYEEVNEYAKKNLPNEDEIYWSTMSPGE